MITNLFEAYVAISGGKMVLKVSEVAKLLGINKNTVYDLINAGRLKAIKISSTKITLEDLIVFLREYTGYDLSDPINPVKMNSGEEEQ